MHEGRIEKTSIFDLQQALDFMVKQTENFRMSQKIIFDESSKML